MRPVEVWFTPPMHSTNDPVYKVGESLGATMKKRIEFMPLIMSRRSCEILARRLEEVAGSIGGPSWGCPSFAASRRSDNSYLSSRL